MTRKVDSFRHLIILTRIPILGNNRLPPLEEKSEKGLTVAKEICKNTRRSLFFKNEASSTFLSSFSTKILFKEEERKSFAEPNGHAGHRPLD